MRRTGFATVVILAMMIATFTPAYACCHVCFNLPFSDNRASATLAQDGYTVSIGASIVRWGVIGVVSCGVLGPHVRETRSISINVQSPDGTTYGGTGTMEGQIVRLTAASLTGTIGTTEGDVSVSLHLHANGTPSSEGSRHWVSATGLAEIVLADGTVIGPLTPTSATLESHSFPL